MHETGVSAERVVLTTLHAGGKFDNDAYKTSGGLHGVGSSVVNALSKHMTVQIRQGGFLYEDRYEQGVPVQPLEKGLLPVIGTARGTGTKINFLPDDEIFEKTRFKEEDIKSRLHETAYLNPQLTIIYEDKREGTQEKLTFHEPDGIIGFVRELNKNNEALTDVIYYSGEVDGIQVSLALQYINEFHEEVMGFCNNIYNAEGGTHLTGFKTMFTQVINSYARQLGTLKEKDVNFTGRRLDQAPGPAVRGTDQDQAGQPGRREGGQPGHRRRDRHVLRPEPGCAEDRHRVRGEVRENPQERAAGEDEPSHEAEVFL